MISVFCHSYCMITKSESLLIHTIILLSISMLTFQFFGEEVVYHRIFISNGELWRIVSGNFTHSNFPHLFLNLAGLWIFTFLFIDTLKTKTFIVSTTFLSIFVGLGLYLLNPELTRYYGFSGVLYGLFICGATGAILHKDLFTGASVIIFIIGKVIWDLYYGGNSSSEELIGIPVAVDAHLYGLIGAMIISSFLIFKQHRTKYTPPTF